MAGVCWEFTYVHKYVHSGTAHTDITREMQSPAGTSQAVFETASDGILLGHEQKFDMAMFYLDAKQSTADFVWYYSVSTGDGWERFEPASSRWAIDPDDTNFGRSYNFTADGAEVFPANLLPDWASTQQGSITRYWIRVLCDTASTVSLKRIMCRPLAVYATSKQVFELLQLKNVTNTTDFTAATVPSKDTVEYYINEAQSYIDMNTRKSWRPNYVVDEHHEFNLSGLKLHMPDPQSILSLKIWEGADWETKTQGRKSDYFFIPATGMVHFARYFLLPARFQSYNAPVWRWGGGEFSQPIKITYLAGKDINIDITQGGIVQDICKKMAAIDVIRNADFGQTDVSGMDRVSQSERVQQWQEEIEDRIDFLTGFETF